MARLSVVAAGVVGRAVSDLGLGAGVQQVMAAVESTSRIVRLMQYEKYFRFYSCVVFPFRSVALRRLA